MKLNKVIHHKNAFPQSVHSDNPYEGRIGFWAVVQAIDAKHNWCDIISDQGLKYYSIPVVSNEWVRKTDDYITGEINLPPVESRVFVLTPDGTMAGAFILCSGFPYCDTSVRKIWPTSDEEGQIHKKITQSGWTITEDYSNGDLTLTDKEAKTTVSITEENGIQITTDKNIQFTTEKAVICESSSTSEKSSVGNSNYTLDKAIYLIVSQLATAFVTGQVTITPTFTTAMQNLQTVIKGYYKGGGS